MCLEGETIWTGILIIEDCRERVLMIENCSKICVAEEDRYSFFQVTFCNSRNFKIFKKFVRGYTLLYIFIMLGVQVSNLEVI